LYDQVAVLDMIAWSQAAYLVDPADYKHFPPGTYVNTTFSGTTDDGTAVFGYAGIQEASRGRNARIVIAFQGTADTKQLIAEILDSDAVSWPVLGNGNVTVAQYFMDAFNALTDGATAALTSLMYENPSYDVFVTGHSLGGALASLFSVASIVNGVLTTPPSMYTFGQPRVGNYDYAQAHLQLMPNVFRMVNNRDPVPHIPLEGPATSSVANDARYGHPESKSWKEQVRRAHQQLRAAGAAKGRTAKVQSVESLEWAFHHGWELWYPAGEYQNSVECGFRFCCGAPYGEDPSCSDQLDFDCGDLFDGCIGDHHGYWWLIPNGFCQPQGPSTSSSQPGDMAADVNLL
jgi:hypothetical protein